MHGIDVTRFPIWHGLPCDTLHHSLVQVRVRKTLTIKSIREEVRSLRGTPLQSQPPKSPFAQPHPASCPTPCQSRLDSSMQRALVDAFSGRLPAHRRRRRRRRFGASSLTVDVTINVTVDVNVDVRGKGGVGLRPARQVRRTYGGGGGSCGGGGGGGGGSGAGGCSRTPLPSSPSPARSSRYWHSSRRSGFRPTHEPC